MEWNEFLGYGMSPLPETPDHCVDYGLPAEPEPVVLPVVQDTRPDDATFQEPEPVFHFGGMAVLCIRGDSFTVTNGCFSLSVDNGPCIHDRVFDCVQKFKVGKLFFTDRVTKMRWDVIMMSKNNLEPLDTFMVHQKKPMGVCPSCKETCHRYMAVAGGIDQLLPFPSRLIPH